MDADPRQHFSILVIRRLAHWLWVIGAYALVFGLMMIFLAFRSLGAGRTGWLEAQPDSRFGRYSWRLDT